MSKPVLQNATTPEDIQSFLDKNGGIAVVDCFATWCGPCKHIAPYVHQKHNQTNIPLITVDVDKAADLSLKYSVEAMPTFLVIKGKWNNIIKRIVGGGEFNVNEVFEAAVKNK